MKKFKLSTFFVSLGVYFFLKNAFVGFLTLVSFIILSLEDPIFFSWSTYKEVVEFVNNGGFNGPTMFWVQLASVFGSISFTKKIIKWISSENTESEIRYEEN